MLSIKMTDQSGKIHFHPEPGKSRPQIEAEISNLKKLQPNKWLALEIVDDMPVQHHIKNEADEVRHSILEERQSAEDNDLDEQFWNRDA